MEIYNHGFEVYFRGGEIEPHLAQLVEQSAYTGSVLGSSPRVRTIIFICFLINVRYKFLDVFRKNNDGSLAVSISAKINNLKKC